MIIVCTIPIITRIYPPEIFGLFAIFVTMSQILASFASLRYEYAILKPQKDTDAVSVVWLSLMVGLGTTVCFCGAVKFLPNEIFTESWRNINQHISLFFTSSYVGSMILVLNFWLIRRNFFSCLGIAKVLEASISRTAIITLGLLGQVSSFGLIISFILGQLATFLTMFSSAVHRDRQLIKDGLNINNIKIQAGKFHSFALYSPSVLFNTARRELPVLALSFFFDPVLVGYYALCQRVVGQPLGMMGDALARSFFQKVTSQYHNDEKVDKIALKLLQFQLFLTLTPCILLSLASQELFTFIFGSKWQPASSFFNIVWPFFLCSFFFRPLSVFFDLFCKQKQLLVFDFSLFALSIVAFAVGAIKHNPYHALLLFTVVNLMSYVFVIRKLLIYIDCPSIDIYHAIKTPLLYALSFGILSWIGRTFIFDYNMMGTLGWTLVLSLLYMACIATKLKYLISQR